MLKRIIKPIQERFSQSKFLTRRDPYQSLQVVLSQKVTSEEVRQQISSFEKVEKDKKSNAIWIFLNSQNLQHAGLLVNEFGFKIHHGQNNKIALYKWLSDKSNLVPPYSSFYISCGSVVIDNDHILMVQQNNGPRKGLFGIPGGRADAGEFLQNTAERQLFEETGIVSKFQHFVYFRYLENTVFGAGDLYFVCLMKAEEESMRKIKLCERQLASFQWVHLSKLDQFVKQKTMGTQRSVGNYLSQLYKQGYRFQTSDKQQYPNTTNQNVFIRGFDGIQRKYHEYKLINLKQKDSNSKVL